MPLPPPVTPPTTPGWTITPANPPQAANGLAIAGMILGITSIVLCWWGILSLAQVVLAIVFGGIAIDRANRGAPHKGMAIAGWSAALWARSCTCTSASPRSASASSSEG